MYCRIAMESIFGIKYDDINVLSQNVRCWHYEACRYINHRQVYNRQKMGNEEKCYQIFVSVTVLALATSASSSFAILHNQSFNISSYLTNTLCLHCTCLLPHNNLLFKDLPSLHCRCSLTIVYLHIIITLHVYRALQYYIVQGIIS